MLPFVLFALASPFLVAAATFLACGLAAGMPFDAAWQALVEQSGAERHNPMKAAPAGLIPVGLVFLGRLVVRRVTKSAATAQLAARWGLLVVLAVLAWANHDFWSIFLPDRKFPGWPHGLELVIGPLFVAPIALVLVMLVVAIAGRQRKDAS